MKKILSLCIAVMFMLGVVGCSNSGNDSEGYKIIHGEKLEEHINDDVLVIKAKIEPSTSNKTTISQNGFNVEYIIKNQDGDQFKEIQYWAVADMTDGSEQKVVSFTLNENMIKSIKEGNTPANSIVQNADDVYVLPSLLQ